MVRKLKNEELGRLSTEQYKSAEKINVSIVLDNIRSMQNIGSVFRTSDAFRIEKIFLIGITAQPPHREINKTALGATESVDWMYFPDQKSFIESIGNEYSLVVVEQTDHSIPLNEFQPDANVKYALIFGNEVFGVSDEFIEASSEVVEIPQFGTKHSLNIAVSAGIVIWEFWNKIRH